MPRAEAACAVCACKDWLEHRHKLSLFGIPPIDSVGAFQCSALHSVPMVHEDSADEDADEESKFDCFSSTCNVIKHKGIYYIQSPEKVHKLLDVERS